jgi:hypothetical protein
MAHEIEKKDWYIEVRVSGPTSKHQILNIILQLNAMDPGKKLPDLWIFSWESQVPLVHFHDIARIIRQILPKHAVGSKSALVADGEFQKAQLELYQTEAAILPYPVGVFRSTEEALEWLKSPTP